MKSGLVFTSVLLLFLFLAFLAFYTIIEYKPKDKETITGYIPSSMLEERPLQTEKDEILNSGMLTLLSWNLGYGGMGKDMDFYFDGGKRVNPTEDEFNKNYEGIIKFTSENKADINLFQEVDVKSQRSYFNDMANSIMTTLGGSNYFAYNFKNVYVPFPLKSPIGTVESGLFTSSKYLPNSIQRVSLPNENGWPKKIFNLKRGILELRYAHNGKELIIANIHNSAFDKGDVRKAQINFIAQQYMDEYAKGNYVILGGDFNMILPGSKTQGSFNYPMHSIDPDIFPSNWTWAFDDTVFSNRDGSIPYSSTSGLGIIDGFLLSPNVKLLKAKSYDLGFEYSDHQPVKIEVILN